jgi:8-oxo-dGTP pyrophosphatase MutT (NUDIX family)
MDTIKIAAAIIQDNDGRHLLVRKANTSVFMQAGGKIDVGEAASAALIRELKEELGVDVAVETVKSLGTYQAPAANEVGYIVEADLFEVTLIDIPKVQAEIAELIWLSDDELDQVPLAPLTKDIVFPLAAQLDRA